MLKLQNIFVVCVLFLAILTGCQKMEEIEPMSEGTAPSNRAYFSGDADDDGTGTASDTDPSYRGAGERPDDDVDNVNDDDDDESDDEEESLVLN